HGTQAGAGRGQHPVRKRIGQRVGVRQAVIRRGVRRRRPAEASLRRRLQLNPTRAEEDSIAAVNYRLAVQAIGETEPGHELVISRPKTIRLTAYASKQQAPANGELLHLGSEVQQVLRLDLPRNRKCRVRVPASGGTIET